MKKPYLLNLCLFIVVLLVTACNPKYRFVTKGLREVDSSYVIKKGGERINAAKIDVRAASVTVDGKKMDPEELLTIKSKKMYFSVDDGKIYPAEIHGKKINLLYKLTYIHSYNTGGQFNSGSTSTVEKGYYLQKEGSPNVDRLTRSTFLEYVGDNPEALSLAKAHYVWNYTSFVSFAGYGVGVIYFVNSVSNNKPLGAPIALLGGSFVAHLIFTSIADHKLKSAIAVYNEGN